MSTNNLKDNGFKVSTSELCEILGLSSRRVQQLAKEEALVRISHGVYDLPASIQSYVDYFIEQSKPDEKLNTLTEDFLLTKAKREKAQIEVEIIKGNLHRTEDIEAVMNDMLASFRAQLLVLPNKVAPLILAQTEVEVIKTIIKRYVNEALQELSDYDPDMFYSKSKNKITDEDEEIKVAEDKEPPDGKPKRSRKQN